MAPSGGIDGPTKNPLLRKNALVNIKGSFLFREGPELREFEASRESRESAPQPSRVVSLHLTHSSQIRGDGTLHIGGRWLRGSREDSRHRRRP